MSYAEDLRLREGGPAPALELPWTVAQVIRQRVAALPEQARELLGIAAVIGRRGAPLSRDPGRGHGGRGGARRPGEGGCRPAPGRRRGERLSLRPRRDPGNGRDGSLDRPKQLLHRRIGEALEEDRPADVDALAYHFVRSDDGEKALQYLELAGDDAQRRFAHAAAIGFYREAVVRLDRLDRACGRASIRERLGAALFLSARYDEAIEVLEEALAVYQETGDDEGVRRVSGRIADATFRRGGGHDTIEEVAALADESEAQGRISPGSLTAATGAPPPALGPGRLQADAGRRPRADATWPRHAQ